MRGLIALVCAICFSVVLGGCSQDKAAFFLGPRTMPIWLAARQYYGVEKEYAMSAGEAESMVLSAISSTGGTYRYTTTNGTAKTIYARTSDDQHVVIDIDPFRGEPNHVEIDINVGFIGDTQKINALYAAMPAQPMVKTAAKTDKAEKSDKTQSCDCQ